MVLLISFLPSSTTGTVEFASVTPVVDTPSVSPGSRYYLKKTTIALAIAKVNVRFGIDERNYERSKAETGGTGGKVKRRIRSK